MELEIDDFQEVNLQNLQFFHRNSADDSVAFHGVLDIIVELYCNN